MSAVIALGGAAVLGGLMPWRRRIWRALHGIIEWEGERGRLTVGSPAGLAVLGSIGVLSLAFLGGIGGGIAGGLGGVSGDTSPFEYGAPNAPEGMDVIVDDTSTWRVTFPAFSGSGDDTQDSISVTVLRSGAADTLFHAVSETQSADTISDNTDLKADTTYRVLGRHHGANGGWSNADTLSVLNSVGVVDWFCDWRHDTGTGDNAVRGTASVNGSAGLDECFGFRTAAPPGPLNVVAKGDATGCTGWPSGVTNVLQVDVVTDDGQLVVTDTVIDAPAVGEVYFHRQYFCTDAAVGASVNKHFTHTGSNEPANDCSGNASGCYSGRWFFWTPPAIQADSTFEMRVGSMVNGSGLGRGVGLFSWGGDGATEWHTHTTYVLEFRIDRFHTDSVLYSTRVTDTDGNVVADAEDFLCASGTCADDGYNVDIFGEYPVALGDIRRFRGLEVGSNGATGPSEQYIYLCCEALAIRADTADWIGLYPVGAEAN